jgi:hypothetical protein
VSQSRPEHQIWDFTQRARFRNYNIFKKIFFNKLLFGKFIGKQGRRIVAYVKKEEDAIGLAYPLSKVWASIPKALNSLGWKVERIDNIIHCVKAKAKASLMAWVPIDEVSVFVIDAVSINKNTARVSVTGETSSALADYGRTRKRINLFFQELQKQLP